MFTRRRLLTTLPFAALVPASCEKPIPPPRYQMPLKPVEVVTSTVQAADLVRMVGGEAVAVRSLLPARFNPHEWQPTATDAATARLADVFILSGLGLESRFGETPADLRKEGLYVGVLANALEDSDILHYADGSPDPHFWMDPRLFAKAANEVAAVLGEAAPASQTWFTDRSHACGVQMAHLYNSTLQTFAELAPRHRFLLSSHDSMAYFGKAYEIEIRSLATPAGQTPTSPPEELSTWVAEHQVRTLFREFFAEAASFKPLCRTLKITRDHILFSLSLGETGHRVVGVTTEHEVDHYQGAFRCTTETIMGALHSI